MNFYLDLLMQMILFFSHKNFIMPFLILGYIWGKREIFFYSMCLTLVSMIVNVALKVTFQIPLNPAIATTGFAFPSGHMQTSAVLYGSLYMSIHNKTLKRILITVLPMIGASLLYFGFHTLIDILGAIFVAIALITICIYWKLYSTLTQIGTILLLTSMCMVYTAYLDKIPSHALSAYGILWGVLISQTYISTYAPTLPRTFVTKMISTVLCSICVLGLSVLLTKADFQTSALVFLRWVCFGFLIPVGVFVAEYFFNYRRSVS